MHWEKRDYDTKDILIVGWLTSSGNTTFSEDKCYQGPEQKQKQKYTFSLMSKILKEKNLYYSSFFNFVQYRLSMLNMMYIVNN
jgi:hypothetical protein